MGRLPHFIMYGASSRGRVELASLLLSPSNKLDMCSLLEKSLRSVYGLKQLMVINFLQRNGNVCFWKREVLIEAWTMLQKFL